MTRHMLLLLLLVSSGCTYKYWPLGRIRYNHGGSFQWNYHLNIDTKTTIVLDEERYPIPRISVALPAIPKNYSVVTYVYMFKYPRQQTIIVEYQYADHLPNNPADGFFDNPIYGKYRQKKNRITKTDTVGRFSIHYLNILPKYMPYLEGATAKVVE